MYYLNGKIYDKEQKGKDFFYAYSLFETMYGIEGKVVFLEEHLERLYSSAKKIELFIGFDIKEELKKFIEKFPKKKEFMVKIQISEDELYMKISDFQGREEEKGVSAEFIEGFYQNELGYLKSANYLGNYLARKNLKSYEGIFLNRCGCITEGTISNVFFTKDNVVYTPSLDLNILTGITRNKIIEICKKNSFEVQEGHYSPKDLIEAESIFFTNSLMKKGLLWVSKLGDIEKNKTVQIHKIEKDYLKMLGDMI